MWPISGTAGLDPKSYIKFHKHHEHTSKKRKTENATKKKTANLASKSPIPSASAPLGRSIISFARLLLGIDPATHKIPDPPSNEIVNQWRTSQTERERMIKAIQDKPRTKLTPAQRQLVIKAKTQKLVSTFKNPKFVPTTDYALPPGQMINTKWKRQAEAQLAQTGISCFRYLWGSSMDGEWNSIIITHIVLGWKACYHGKGLINFSVSDESVTDEAVFSILERWISGQSKKFADMSKDKSSETQKLEKVKLKKVKVQMSKRRREVSMFIL